MEVPLMEYTRDYAREVWKKSGYDYSVLTYPNLYQLTKRVAHYLDLHTELQMWIHRDRKGVPFNEFPRYQPPFEWVEITIDGSYFEDREGITFNRDGFIGFAGWACDSNVQPILKAFIEWVEWMIEYGIQNTDYPKEDSEPIEEKPETTKQLKIDEEYL